MNSTFELQSGIVAAALASGKPVLNAGRGEPNWIPLEPRAALFTLGQFATTAAAEASPSPDWGLVPTGPASPAASPRRWTASPAARC